MGRRMLRLGLSFALAISLVPCLMYAPGAFAASVDVERAETLIWGTEGHSSPATGRLVLEQAAEQGDLAAMRALGMHLVYGWVLSKEVSKGLDLLEQAASGGDADAQNDLGQIYLWGLAGLKDAKQSRKYLEASSAQGHLEAMRTLGKQLVMGTLFEQDVNAGIGHLKAALAQDDAKSYVTLGVLYLEGSGVPLDRDTARKNFEKAADLGDGEGLLRFGENTMWQEIDSTIAEDALLRAAEIGETKAYVVLANGAMYGYLGGGSVSRKKYQTYADKAVEAGEEYIAVLEAERLLWGIGVRASGPRAIESLTSAADQGNSEAARFLIALLRDGNNLNVRQSSADAQKALLKYSGLLSQKQREQYDLTLKAARAKTPSAYAPVADAFMERTDLSSTWFGKEIYKANSNVAFYILQVRLKYEGLYKGTVHGLATRQTLKAVFEACLKSVAPKICKDNVMRADVIGALLAKK